jgi:16S rRNA (guanine966-N2)-methyltransferase
MGQIRIISGQWGRRRITVSDRPGLRPTSDRARETLFNWLESWLPWPWHAVHVLDGYAGSGVLGLECASRGAASVTMIEQDAIAVRDLSQHLTTLQAPPSVRLMQGRFLDQLALQPQAFELVFLDPPFGKGLILESLKALCARMVPEGMVYVESETAWPCGLSDADQQPWTVVRAAKTGQSHQTLLSRVTSPSG